MKAKVLLIIILVGIGCLTVLTGAVWLLCNAGLALWKSIIIVVALSVLITITVLIAVLFYIFDNLD